MDIKGKKSPGEANNSFVSTHAFEATFFKGSLSSLLPSYCDFKKTQRDD